MGNLFYPVLTRLYLCTKYHSSSTIRAKYIYFLTKADMSVVHVSTTFTDII